MRDIKFRAWHKEKNIMVYDNEDDTYGYWDGCCNSNVGMVNTILNSKWYKQYEFMQYTGLKDKNGKEIYEGDIVRIDNNVRAIKAQVEYSETFAQYIITHTGDIVSEAEPLGDYDEIIEVIGNIYENKDLLEKEGQPNDKN